MTRSRILLERDYRASIAEIWALWTTREGIESWWGPEGFRVEVQSLDLRPGGELRYAMIADAPDQIEFMKRAGMPLTHDAKITYVEIVAPRRLVYVHLVDFVPGVTAYDVHTVLDLEQTATGVHLRVELDPMQDDTWTQRSVMGWESELGKLASLLERRGALRKVAFTMIPVQDADRARSFYETTLGLRRGSAAGNGVWTEYDLPGGGCVALFRTDDIQPSAGAGSSVAFEVEDLDALNARLRATGVNYRAPMIHSPVCRMSIITDSEGNALILHQLHPK